MTNASAQERAVEALFDQAIGDALAAAADGNLGLLGGSASTYARAAIAALTPPESIHAIGSRESGEGDAWMSAWEVEDRVLVPREPTAAMLEKGSNHLFGWTNDDAHVDIRLIWAAMLAAAEESGRG